MKLLLLSENMGAVKEFLPGPAKIDFIPTAGEPYPDPSWVRKCREWLTAKGYATEDIDLSHSGRDQLIDQIDAVDALFVAGGNTFYLLQQIHRANLYNFLRQHMLADKPYIGASAGSIICGPDIASIECIDAKQAAPELKSTIGLDLVDFLVLPHYGRDDHVAAYRNLHTAYGYPQHFLPLRDDQAISVSGRLNYQIIPS